MVRTMVIAVAVVTFVAGVQVSDGRFLTSEPQSSATQGSTTTAEQQEESSGVQESHGGDQASEPKSTTSEESTTRGEQQEGSSGTGDIVTPPGSDDPDCNNRDGANHIFSRCTFTCGDEAVALRNGEKCILPGTSAAPLPSESPLARANMDTGICQEGECIIQEQGNVTFPGTQGPDGGAQTSEPQSSATQVSTTREQQQETSDTVQEQGSTAEGVSTANVTTGNVTTESIPTENVSTGYTPNESTPNESTPNESAANENVTTESVITEDVSTKNLTTENGTNEFAPTTTNAPAGNMPTENDPDCRGAMDRNHVYVDCTYSCQLDEAFAAPDNSSCYVSGTNNTLISTNVTEEPNKIIGRCQDGLCVTLETQTPVAMD